MRPRERNSLPQRPAGDPPDAPEHMQGLCWRWTQTDCQQNWPWAPVPWRPDKKNGRVGSYGHQRARGAGWHRPGLPRLRHSPRGDIQRVSFVSSWSPVWFNSKVSGVRAPASLCPLIIRCTWGRYWSGAPRSRRSSSFVLSLTVRRYISPNINYNLLK